jgi:hypothetical protein
MMTNESKIHLFHAANQTLYKPTTNITNLPLFERIINHNLINYI